MKTINVPNKLYSPFMQLIGLALAAVKKYSKEQPYSNREENSKVR